MAKPKVTFDVAAEARASHGVELYSMNGKVLVNSKSKVVPLERLGL